MEFFKFDINRLILSPANIYWKKKSGDPILVSTKYSIFNAEIIHKLMENNQELYIEESFDLEFIDTMTQLLNHFDFSYSIKTKANMKHIFLSKLKNKVIDQEISQLELNYICLQLFSGNPAELYKGYIEQNFDLFNRALTVASSTIMCSLYLGYYNISFLRNLFDLIIYENMLIYEKNKNSGNIVEFLKQYQNMPELTTTYFRAANQINKSLNIENNIFFERPDGQGLLGLMIEDLPDSEALFCFFNNLFAANYNPQDKNILCKINQNDIIINNKINKSIINMLGEC